jgi:hypothetical protein
MFVESVAAMLLAGAGQEAGPMSGRGQERVIPRGDYRESCGGVYMNRGRLYADCRTRRGHIVGSSIQLNRCRDYEIRNDDGLLVCGPVRGQFESGDGGGGWGEGGGWDNGGGWGGGRTAIIVYRDANFSGGSLRFDREVPNLAQSGFNDVISSMQLRGEWQVCTDAYFRGSCRMVTDDVVNLRSWGINDRISSLRPMGRGYR